MALHVEWSKKWSDPIPFQRGSFSRQNTSVYDISSKYLKNYEV